MLRKKFCLILGLGLVFATSFGNISYAKNSSNTNQAINTSIDSNLSNSDLSQIKENINTILSQKYQIMKTGTSQDVSNIINDSKLAELVDKTNEFNVKWYKAVNLKVSDYNSSLDISNIKKLSDNNYLVNALYDIEFTLLPDNIKSYSSDEKYDFQVQKIDGTWYISKMINLQEDIDLEAKNTNSFNSNTNEFSNYDKVMGSKLNSIDNISKNINKYIQQYYNNEKASNNLDTDHAILAYSGYNATSAVNYALKWALGRNPAYNDYGGNDCTNFVSQAVYNGGIPGSSTWYSGSTAWINVVSFYNYMRSAGYTYGGDYSSGSRLGDVIQFYNGPKGIWSHAAILTGTTGGNGWLYSAHSTNRKNYPVSAVYPSSTYTNLRYIKYWH